MKAAKAELVLSHMNKTVWGAFVCVDAVLVDYDAGSEEALVRLIVLLFERRAACPLSVCLSVSVVV
jgi:hypothetical protein